MKFLSVIFGFFPSEMEMVHLSKGANLLFEVPSTRIVRHLSASVQHILFEMKLMDIFTVDMSVNTQLESSSASERDAPGLTWISEAFFVFGYTFFNQMCRFHPHSDVYTSI